MDGFRRNNRSELFEQKKKMISERRISVANIYPGLYSVQVFCPIICQNIALLKIELIGHVDYEDEWRNRSISTKHLSFSLSINKSVFSEQYTTKKCYF